MCHLQQIDPESKLPEQAHNSLRLHHNKHHLEPLFSLKRMRNICRHDNHLSRPRSECFATNRQFRFPVKYPDDRIKGGGMFAQPLPCIGTIPFSSYFYTPTLSKTY